MKNKNTIISNILLFSTAVLWGSSFSSRKIGLEHITPLIFNGLRFFIGFLCVLGFFLIMRKSLIKRDQETGMIYKPLSFQFKMGFFSGTILAAGAVCQQLALTISDAGVVAFLTSVYAVLVPIMGAVFLKMKVDKKVWVGAFLAFVGIYLISGGATLSFSIGDVLGLLSAVAFGIQVLIVGRAVPHMNGVFLSLIQLFFTAFWNFILGFIFEHGNTISEIMVAFWPLMYSGVMAIGIPYTLQIIGQRNANPSVAAIILSLESAFGLIFAIIILHESITPIQFIGCVLIFSAVVLSQFKKKDINDINEFTE